MLWPFCSRAIFCGTVVDLLKNASQFWVMAVVAAEDDADEAAADDEADGVCELDDDLPLLPPHAVARPITRIGVSIHP
jgi:hypothetical protein